METLYGMTAVAVGIILGMGALGTAIAVMPYKVSIVSLLKD